MTWTVCFPSPRTLTRLRGTKDCLSEDRASSIMVTPLSQFVGSQAAINVMTGARYGQVTDEVIQYALGH